MLIALHVQAAGRSGEAQQKLSRGARQITCTSSSNNSIFQRHTHHFETLALLVTCGYSRKPALQDKHPEISKHDRLDDCTLEMTSCNQILLAPLGILHLNSSDNHVHFSSAAAGWSQHQQTRNKGDRVYSSVEWSIESLPKLFTDFFCGYKLASL